MLNLRYTEIKTVDQSFKFPSRKTVVWYAEVVESGIQLIEAEKDREMIKKKKYFILFLYIKKKQQWV